MAKSLIFDSNFLSRINDLRPLNESSIWSRHGTRVASKMQFDRRKLKAAILHTCRRVKPDKLGAVKLHKVLYFLDMVQFAAIGSAVTGATYRKRPYGPTCVQLLPTLREMVDEGLIEIREVAFHGLRKTEYYPQKHEERGVLNKNEEFLLDRMIDFVCHKHTAKSISDFSHKLPWEIVDFGEVIPYESALLLFPADTSPEAFEIAQEGIEEIEAERSQQDPLGAVDYASFRGRVLAEIGQR